MIIRHVLAEDRGRSEFKSGGDDETSDLSALYFAILEYMEQLNSEKAKFILRMDW